MNIVDINSIKPPGEEASTFQGLKHGASISFFVVQFSPGKGPKKHRHPYEEPFVILDGEIEVIVDDQTQTVSAATIVIVPANTWHELKNLTYKPVIW